MVRNGTARRAMKRSITADQKCRHTMRLWRNSVGCSEWMAFGQNLVLVSVARHSGDPFSALAGNRGEPKQNQFHACDPKQGTPDRPEHLHQRLDVA